MKGHLQHLQQKKKIKGEKNTPKKTPSNSRCCATENMPPKKKGGAPAGGSGDIRAFCTTPNVLRDVTNTPRTVATPTPAVRQAFSATRNLKLGQIRESGSGLHGEEDVMYSGDCCELRMRALRMRGVLAIACESCIRCVLAVANMLRSRR